MRAFIVDDNRKFRERFAEMLIESGLFTEVATASNVPSARERLLMERFDIAIVDVDIAGEDGLDLIADLKAKGTNQVFFVMSALPVSDFAARACWSGAASFLPKGCPPATILSALTRAMK